jgi:micrococcal nuclease
MKLKLWQILVIITFGIGAFCLVCLASSLFIGLYSSLSASPTVLVDNRNIAENATTPFHTETPGLSFQVAETEIPKPSDTFTLIPSNTIPPTLTTIPTNPPESMPANPPTSKVSCVPAQTPQLGIVTKVVDGDTIDVAIDNQTFPVRYIGMDTPESGEPMGLQAKTQNALLVEGKSVTLYRDKSETDQYNQLLRYVFVGDIFVNYEMVKSGYGEAKSYELDTACDNYFVQAQNEAMAASLGLWAILPTMEVRLPSPIPLETTGNCDPAYPTVCIPSPPPDLDCKDVSYKNFKVLQPDPHNFDGDGNGIGCENP